jgi:hypothetical protein
MKYCKDCRFSYEKYLDEYECRNNYCREFPTGNARSILKCRQESGPCKPEGKHYEYRNVGGTSIPKDSIQDCVALLLFGFSFLVLVAVFVVASSF